MHTSAIAVVIPVYNAGRFIDESIDSVRAQTTPQWEFMIVDDGSTDETPSRLAAFRDPRIRWIRQDNIGERAARARGVSLTRAPKIVCLDADDRLYPDALARCVSFLDKHPQGDVLESILRARFSPHPPRLVCVERWCPPRSG